MFKRAALLCLTIYLAFTLTGCGAIFLGSTRTIEVSGSPEGTEIESSPTLGSYVVPTALKLQRGKDYVLKFRKAGYKEETVVINKKFLAGTLIADILLGGIIAIVVDAVTGSWYGHTPSTVDVVLQRNTTGFIGPDKIEITLSKSDKNDDEILLEGAEGVQVELTETK